MAKITGPDTAQYVEEAFDRHCEVGQGLAPGFFTLNVDTDVHLAAWERMIPGPVVFHVNAREYKEKGMNAPLYMFKFDPGEIERKISEAAELHEREIEETGKGGTWVIDEPLSLSGQLTQLAVPGRDWPLMYGEVPMWLAVYDAEQAGDEELAHRIFEQGYVPVKSDLPADIIDAPSQDIVPVRENVQGDSWLTKNVHKLENGKLKKFDMAGKDDIGRVETSLVLSYDNENVSMDRPMTRYDRAVHNAIATLWRAGARTFSVAQVYEAMAGSTANQKAARLQKISDSISKQMQTMAELDYSEEARGRHLTFDGEEVTGYIERQHVLSGKEQNILFSDGTIRTGYTLFDPPLLYKHDVITGQFAKCPHRVLKAVSNAVPATDMAILVRDYLIRRIHAMKEGKTASARNPRIQFSKIYEEAEKPDATRTEKSRIRKMAGKMLDAMRDEGYIAGWDHYAKDGQARANGFIIELPKAGKGADRRGQPER